MPPVKSRREQYSDATRAALLETATEMFTERGFAGTTLADVASAAQVTRGAVYHHFENKQALFMAVFEELEEEAMARVRAAYDDASEPLAGAFAALGTFLDKAREPVYSEIVWRQAPIALGWPAWRECELRFSAGMIEEILSQLVDAGIVNPVPVQTTSQIAFSMLGGAGTAIAEAPEADRDRVHQESLDVLGRFISGLLVNRPPS